MSTFIRRSVRWVPLGFVVAVACETTIRVPPVEYHGGRRATAPAAAASNGGVPELGQGADGSVAPSDGGDTALGEGSMASGSAIGRGGTGAGAGHASGSGQGGKSPSARGGTTGSSAATGGSDGIGIAGVDAAPDGAAGEGGGAGAPDVFAEPPRCTSGLVRDPNESEGPDMMPGHACNECHARSNAASGEGDAPIFAFAGTLFPTGHEPNDCIGVSAEGALVIVTDADGVEWSATANEVGNFSLEGAAFALPITARVLFQGRERRMETPATGVDCNACHTAAGLEDAPGRIVLP